MSAAQKDDRTATEKIEAEAELAVAAASEAASKALRAGARAPLFTLVDTAGEKFSLEERLDAGPVVLHYFRGAWCTFGQESVADFAANHAQVLRLGATAVAIAPPCRAGGSIGLPIRELQDAEMKVARAYGLAFDLPQSLRPRYESLGYRPPALKKSQSFLVPIPATYLLDRSGVVVLAFVDVDYRNRFEGDSLLTALLALRTREAGPGRTGRARL